MNRDLFTSSGNEWYDPLPEDLIEYRQGGGAWFVRTRTWSNPTNRLGMHVFSQWSEWEFMYDEETTEFFF